MSIAEKVLARKFNREEFDPGDMVDARLDGIMCKESLVDTDNSLIKAGVEGGVTGLWDNDTSYGALNATGTSIEETELASALAFGELWFMVPESIRVEMFNRLPKTVTSKDIILYLAGKYSAEFPLHKSIAFSDAATKYLSIASRLCMCTHGVDVGAKFACLRRTKRLLATSRQELRRNLLL